MPDLSRPVLEYILTVCIDAIKGDAYISSQSCSTVDNLVSFVFKQCSKPHYLCNRFSELEHLLRSLLVSIWEVILWNEPENLWSLSRPCLPLLLLNQAFFQQYVEMICSNQPLERQKMLQEVDCFTYICSTSTLNIYKNNKS